MVVVSSCAHFPRVVTVGDLRVFLLLTPPFEDAGGADVAMRSTLEENQVLTPSPEDFKFFLGGGTGRMEEEA